MEKLRNTLNKVLNLLAGLSMTVMVVPVSYTHLDVYKRQWQG